MRLSKISVRSTIWKGIVVSPAYFGSTLHRSHILCGSKPGKNAPIVGQIHGMTEGTTCAIHCYSKCEAPRCGPYSVPE